MDVGALNAPCIRAPLLYRQMPWLMLIVVAVLLGLNIIMGGPLFGQKSSEHDALLDGRGKGPFEWVDEVQQLRDTVQEQRRVIQQQNASLEALRAEFVEAKREYREKLGASPPALADLCNVSDDIQQVPRHFVHWTTDLYPRRIWGRPDEDFKATGRPKLLLAMAVGVKQQKNVNKMIQKFPAKTFSLVLFHYDKSSYESWAQFSWCSRAVHIQVPSQGKWWYAKRFLHPTVVEPFDYIFYWDEDLNLDNLNPIRYVEVMKKHRLEISHPALFPNSGVHYELLRRVNDSEVHRRTNVIISKFFGNKTMCRDGWNAFPCAGFVEVMAPVFTRKAWKCVWHMIQNDLVLGWGADWKFGACAGGPAHENIGIIDSDFVKHMSSSSLGAEPRTGNQTEESLREKVMSRSGDELREFLRRWNESEALQDASRV